MAEPFTQIDQRKKRYVTDLAYQEAICKALGIDTDDPEQGYVTQVQIGALDPDRLGNGMAEVTVRRTLLPTQLRKLTEVLSTYRLTKRDETDRESMAIPEPTSPDCSHELTRLPMRDTSTGVYHCACCTRLVFGDEAHCFCDDDGSAYCWNCCSGAPHRGTAYSDPEE